MREFRVGRVLGRSFSIWVKNLIPFTVLTALVYSPLIIYAVSLYTEDITAHHLENWGRALYLGGRLLDLIATGALIYGVFQQLRGSHASIGACLRAGLGRLFPILGVGILTTLCIFGGTLLLVIPGLILFTMLYVAVPVAVVERPGVMASLKRSRDLTRNHRLRIFAIFIVLLLAQFVVSAMVGFALGLGGEVISMSERKLQMLMTLALSILTGSLGAVVSAVVYHDLRSSKEAIGIEELAGVFE